jgi:hypothetical protein
MSMQFDSASSIDRTSIVLRYATKIGFSPDSSTILRTLKLIRDKGIAISHAIAELLLCKYLMEKGYTCEIEYTINNTKCDVYAEKSSIDECIEIFYYAVPLNSIDDWTNYIILTHLRKIVQMLKSSAHFITFAYPTGLVPLIPPALLSITSKEQLAKIMVKYGLHRFEDLKEFRDTPIIHHVYIFDLSKAKVRKITCEEIKMLVLLYSSITNFE